MTVDAYPGTAVAGVVSEIQSSTVGQLSTYPGTDLDPTNIQKVKQYVPVRIIPTDANGVTLSPGLNVTVHIHTDP